MKRPYRIALRVDADLFQRLTEIGDAYGASLSTVLRMAVVLLVERVVADDGSILPVAESDIPHRRRRRAQKMHTNAQGELPRESQREMSNEAIGALYGALLSHVRTLNIRFDADAFSVAIEKTLKACSSRSSGSGYNALGELELRKRVEAFYRAEIVTQKRRKRLRRESLSDTLQYTISYDADHF